MTPWNGPVLRVLQLNSWNVDGPWVDRLVEIVAMIRHLGPDIVCLQEVIAGSDGRSTAHIIAEQATSAGPNCWHVESATTAFPEEVEGVPEDSTWGVAILSRWPIDETHSQLLADGYPSMWMVMHARTNGLDVFTTHLTPAKHDGLWRERQVLEVEAFVRTHRSSASPLPAVLTGDFNATPDSAEIRFLTGRQSLTRTTEGDRWSTYWQDAWTVAGDGTSGLTWDDDNPFAALLHVHPARIDYVFVGDQFPFNAPSGPGAPSGNGTGKVVRCEVIGRTPITGTHPSDHHGVLCEIAWPERSPRR